MIGNKTSKYVLAGTLGNEDHHSDHLERSSLSGPAPTPQSVPFEVDPLSEPGRPPEPTDSLSNFLHHSTASNINVPQQARTRGTYFSRIRNGAPCSQQRWLCRRGDAAVPSRLLPRRRCTPTSYAVGAQRVCSWKHQEQHGSQRQRYVSNPSWAVGSLAAAAAAAATGTRVATIDAMEIPVWVAGGARACRGGCWSKR